MTQPFKPKCPKCHFTLWAEPCRNGHPTAGCSFCGWRIMGDQAITSLVLAQKKEYDSRRLELRQRAIEEALKEEEARIAALREAERTAEECAWEPCASPRRKTSIYCSRDCSNRNARHRHRLRKAVGSKENGHAVSADLCK